jgi:hypothetical protein
LVSPNTNERLEVLRIYDLMITEIEEYLLSQEPTENQE